MASTTTFTISQAFLGAPLQFVPAYGSWELEQLVDLYVSGPASKQAKFSQVTLDFFNNATVDIANGSLVKTYIVVLPYASPVSQSSGCSPQAWTPSSACSTPLLDSRKTSFSAAATPSSTRVKKTGVTKRRDQKLNETSIPGFQIMTRDGIDVTNSAGRGTKTKEQRDHAHMMRIVKACEACRRKKVRCDPSHRRGQPQMGSTPTRITTSPQALVLTPQVSRESTQSSQAASPFSAYDPNEDFVLFPEESTTDDLTFSALEYQDFDFDLDFDRLMSTPDVNAQPAHLAMWEPASHVDPGQSKIRQTPGLMALREMQNLPGDLLLPNALFSQVQCATQIKDSRRRSRLLENTVAEDVSPPAYIAQRSSPLDGLIPNVPRDLHLEISCPTGSPDRRPAHNAYSSDALDSTTHRMRSAHIPDEPPVPIPPHPPATMECPHHSNSAPKSRIWELQRWECCLRRLHLLSAGLDLDASPRKREAAASPATAHAAQLLIGLLAVAIHASSSSSSSFMKLAHLEVHGSPSSARHAVPVPDAQQASTEHLILWHGSRVLFQTLISYLLPLLVIALLAPLAHQMGSSYQWLSDRMGSERTHKTMCRRDDDRLSDDEIRRVSSEDAYREATMLYCGKKRMSLMLSNFRQLSRSCISLPISSWPS